MNQGGMSQSVCNRHPGLTGRDCRFFFREMMTKTRSMRFMFRTSPIIKRVMLLVIVLPLSAIAGEPEPVLTDFTIGEVRFQIYDNSNDRLVDRQTNDYGLGMDLFMSLFFEQRADVTGNYRITVTGFGEGRDNEAEGIVEDYRVMQTRDVVLYGKIGRFIPFVFEYPCTGKAVFTIVVRSSNGDEQKKQVESKYAYCKLN